MADDIRPVYLRLRDIITASILDGRYDDGAMLPSVRAFAVAQGANPLTVAKAYQSFQDDGIIVVRRGVGLFLSEGASARVRATEKARFLGNVWPPVAAQMRRLGLTMDDMPLGEDA
ncbi:MAG TPA: GntR family transcriptional regulator [Sphingobium sp.]